MILVEFVREPNKLLRQKCSPVHDFEEAKQIANELVTAAKSAAKFWNRWLGFAANQIGYSKRIIVLRKNRDDFSVLINPKLIEQLLPFPYLEKCYSVDGLYLVKRYLWSKVKYQDLNGNWHEIILKGPSAIYQELDHIDGILVSDNGVRIL